MAKKKRKRHRHPVAPPVHSAPEALHHAGGPQVAVPPPRPLGVEPPQAAVEPVYAPPRPRKPPPRRASRRRRKASRPWIITGLVLALIIGAIVFSKVSGNKAANSFNALSASAGCGKLQVTGDSGSGEHLLPGETTKYDTSPPTHGKHDGSGTVPAGVYDKPFTNDVTSPFSIYRAVHSLEHGGIIVWYDRISAADLRALKRHYDGEDKVIVVPYPPLRGKTHVALTAWGRLVDCQRPSTKVVDAFVDRFREARSAPEPKNPM